MSYKKISLGIGILIALLLACVGGLYVRHLNNSFMQVISRCDRYNPEWIGMLDCHGTISIWTPDNSGYLVVNNKEPGLIMAQIQSANAFIIKNEEMFLIDTTATEKCNNLVPEKYCGRFQVNGLPITRYYDNANQVPQFIVANTKTGDERFYSQLHDMRISDRQIFQKLSSDYQK